MDYNTEAINLIAQQLAEMFKSAVMSQQESAGGNPTIAQIEADMREALRQIGNQALGLFLSSMQTTPEKEIACSCGGRLHYQRMRAARVISVFGRTRYVRACYAGCDCKEGKAPIDEQFGLEPGAVTAGLATLLALAGIEFSYDKSPKWLQTYLLFDISENTVRSETEQMGLLQEKRKGEEKEAHEDWRDMKMLCWFETETVPPSQRSKRQQKKVIREQPALRARNMQYFCDITKAETFGKLLWATGCTLNADLCSDLVFLGDGAVWIWNLVTQYYPNAKQILDWYHAEEHLEIVATAAFPDLSQRTTWLEEATQALWDGQVEDVIAVCQALALTCVQASQAVIYFTNNMERMRYDRFRTAGYMIGSGTIESGCKQVVSQRLKLPGAQWLVSGAVQTAKARAAWLSEQWHILCAKRSALPLAA